MGKCLWAELAALTCPYDCAGSHDVLHQQLLSVRVIRHPVLDVRAPHNLQRHVTLKCVCDEYGDGEHDLDALGQSE
jgi:hypothetical protein